MIHYYGFDIDVRVNEQGLYAWFAYSQDQLMYSSGYEYISENTAFDSACSRIDTLGY